MNVRALFAVLLLSLSVAWGEENLLLKSAGGRVVHASWATTPELDGLIDEGGPIEPLPGQRRLPTEVTFAFSHDRVARLKRVVLRSPAEDDGSRVRDIEVMVSIASAVEGFYAVGAWTVEDKAGPREIALPDLPARFVKLRIISNHGGEETRLAKVEIWGDLPPEETYVVSEIDAKRLAAFRRVRADVPLLSQKRNDLEERLFADAKEGKLHALTLDQAALIAGGVSDEAGLAEHHAKVEALVEEARPVVQQGGGKALLEWLHGRALQRYVAGATDLARVLDTGDFNCISSVTLYNAIGERLGLDLRCVEVPDHAFSILYEGGRGVDVETTTKWSTHPDAGSKQRREVRDVGTVAIVYFNRGVAFSEAGDFAQAFACYAEALDLDPGFSSALFNLLSGHAQWACLLAGKGEFERALAVTDEGLAIDPDSEVLRENLVAAYTSWGLAEVEAKRYEQALAIFEKGLAREPGNFYYARNLRYVYGRWAIDRLDKEGPVKALETIQAALAKFPGDGQLKGAQEALYDDWAKRLLGRARWREALDAYAQGLTAVKGSRLLAHNAAVVYLDQADALAQEEHADEAIALLEEGMKAYPEEASLPRERTVVFAQVGDREGKQGRFERAVAEYDKALALDPGNARLKNNRVCWLQRWAKSLAEAHEWATAIEKFRALAQEDPKQGTYRESMAFCYNAWADACMDRHDWKEAIRVLDLGLSDFPGDNAMTHNRAYCQQQAAK